MFEDIAVGLFSAFRSPLPLNVARTTRSNQVLGKLGTERVEMEDNFAIVMTKT